MRTRKGTVLEAEALSRSPAARILGGAWQDLGGQLRHARGPGLFKVRVPNAAARVAQGSDSGLASVPLKSRFMFWFVFFFLRKNSRKAKRE